jgi:hypothetical protein
LARARWAETSRRPSHGLNARSGKLRWTRKFIRNNKEGIDIAPHVYDDTVLIKSGHR